MSKLIVLLARLVRWFTGAKIYGTTENVWNGDPMEHYVFGWYAKVHKKLGFGAITFGLMVFVVSPGYYRIDHLIKHEHWHTVQQKALGFMFFIKYVAVFFWNVVSFKKEPYREISYEVEAREKESE